MEPIIDDKLNDFDEMKDNEKDVKNPFSIFSNNWKYNVVDNLEAPELYSRKAIYSFTVFCSVFFGGTLMFINLWKLKNRQGQIAVASYSILCGAISFTILGQFERSTILTMMISMLGSLPLYNFFWGKYIGVSTQYRSKSILIPLLLALILIGMFAVVALTNMEVFK
jgi:hypothetical protein